MSLPPRCFFIHTHDLGKQRGFSHGPGAPFFIQDCGHGYASKLGGGFAFMRRCGSKSTEH